LLFLKSTRMGKYNISERHKAQEKVRKSTKQGVVGWETEPPHASSIFLLSLQFARVQKAETPPHTGTLDTQTINIYVFPKQS